MTLRRARGADIPAMEAFLAYHAETSMFLRSNLATHGLDELAHPHGTSFWLSEDDGGLTGVFGATNAGYLMAQAPDVAPDVWAAWAQALDGRMMRGITGEDRQVRRALAAMKLRAELFSVNHAEPLYRLDLDRLPSPVDVIRPAAPGDRAMLAEWYATYLTETGLTDDPARARDEAAARALAACKPGAPERLLLENGHPVAAASINAQVAGMVQVGGVYVPEPLRGRGRGRRVTAARLIEAASGGARQAILFSNNAAASRAYESIGFERIGEYRVAVLKAPHFAGDRP